MVRYFYLELGSDLQTSLTHSFLLRLCQGELCNREMIITSARKEYATQCAYDFTRTFVLLSVSRVLEGFFFSKMAMCCSVSRLGYFRRYDYILTESGWSLEWMSVIKKCLLLCTRLHRRLLIFSLEPQDGKMEQEPFRILIFNLWLLGTANSLDCL